MSDCANPGGYGVLKLHVDFDDGSAWFYPLALNGRRPVGVSVGGVAYGPQPEDEIWYLDSLRIVAIERDGRLYEVVRDCELVRTFHGYPCSDWTCSACGKISNSPHPTQRCPRCGARVTGAHDADGTPVGLFDERPPYDERDLSYLSD